MRYTLGGLIMQYDMDSSFLEFLYFWGHHEKPGRITKACFSQWYPSMFVVDGIRYNCAEQFMMAEKARVFGDEVTRLKILNSEDPAEIKKLGREVKNFDPEKWSEVSVDIVVRGNVAKFSQNIPLKEFILSTEKKVLVEASPYDTIWGIGMKKEEAEKTTPHHWRGTNKLGYALMTVRDILKEENK